MRLSTCMWRCFCDSAAGLTEIVAFMMFVSWSCCTGTMHMHNMAKYMCKRCNSLYPNMSVITDMIMHIEFDDLV